MPIPKLIHYCWFGNNPKPDEILGYIDTWKRCCVDYEIKEWNESNFDIRCNKYVEEAYEQKKWAFVADYVRLYAIYNYGGIYMDSDVEILKCLDSYLEYDGFTGFETADHPLTGIMGCAKGNLFIKEVMDTYETRHFVLPDGNLDLTVNIVPFKEMCIRHGYQMNNKLQIIDGFAIFPTDVFCPFDFLLRQFNITENTVALHHFAGSWTVRRESCLAKLKLKILRLLGPKVSHKLANMKNYWRKCICEKL